MSVVYAGGPLRLRFSALRTGPSTPFLCAQALSVSLRSGQALRLRFLCARQALRLRFSALRTGPSTPFLCAQDRLPSTPLCCAQDRHFDSALLRTGCAWGPSTRLRTGLPVGGGKIIGRGHENEKTLPSPSVKRSAKCKTPRLREPRCQFCEWWSKGRVGRFLKRGLAACYDRTGCSSECGGPVSGPPSRNHQTSC